MKTIILILFLSLNLFGQRSHLLDLFDSGIADDRGNIANILINAGAKNTTDFVQTAAAGDPDDMTLNAAFSITTEGGNRWLRVVRLGGVNDYVGIQGINNGDINVGGGLVVGHTYNIRIKIRGNGGALRINAFNGGWEALPTINAVTIWTATPVVAGDASFSLTFSGEGDTSKYFEIDWIEVWE